MKMLDVSPKHRDHESLPGLNNPSIPAIAPAALGSSDDIGRLVERFGDAILESGLHNQQQVVMVKPERLVEVAEFLRSDAALAYEALTDVTAIDRSKLPIHSNLVSTSGLYEDAHVEVNGANGSHSKQSVHHGDARFHTIYQLRSYNRKKHLMLTCPAMDDEHPEVPSLTPVFEGANWPEREAYDLMGVNFSGHPDLRRILMPIHWPYHPLRKDIPTGGEEVPFTVTWDDPQFATLGDQILPAESIKPDIPKGMDTRNMIINMGPHHPSTHGVLRLVIELDGETVVRIDPDLGYLHSGFEKTGESKRYKDFVYYTDRMDYLSAMSSNLGYSLTVERMLGLEVPERAQVIRVIMNEMSRIAAHLFWLSTHVLDVSGTGMSLLMYATRDRERILDLFEMVCGARLTLSYIRIGGVWKDLPPAFINNLIDFVKDMPSNIDDYEAMLTNQAIWEDRLRGVGHISREQAISMGLTGPMLRGSGVDWDLRRDVPYSGYEHYDFKVPVQTEGDCYARYLVRIEEMRQSLRIIQQGLDNLPGGLYKSDNRKVSLPPRAELDVSMEALIHHFKLVTEGFHVPAGYLYNAVETNKGELGFFVYSDGSGIPYRLHVRGPSFNNLYAIDHMCRNEMLSDVVTNIGSIDIVLGDVDR